VVKSIIIGAGFSSAVLKLLLKNKAKVIGCLDSKIFINNKNYIRRKNLESNKLFLKRAFSFGTLCFDIKKSRFHDRLICGGNTTVWGGHFNLRNISEKSANLLKFYKFNLCKLSFFETGTVSNDEKIVQLQDNAKKIITANTFLKNSITSGYVEKFFLNKNKLFIDFIEFRNNSYNKKTIQVKKLFLSVGVIQLIDLLYRSAYLKNGDIIEFSEFHHKFKFNFLNSPFDKKAITIRYLFARALGHYLGIQRFSKYLQFLKFIPLVIDQIFYENKINLKLQIINNSIVNAYSKNKSKIQFGRSIHYCNMRINGISINKFLSKINNSIIGAGMPFINQKNPGPISNEIFEDIVNKTNKIRFI
jgi:hypothetical protein